MIDLLKSGRIDTALLCELAAHPDFMKLPTDIQIYVEGIAATQIQNLNAWVDVARAEIVEKYRRVHHDIDAIMEDIREAHRGRSDSAPENTIVDELKRNL